MVSTAMGGTVSPIYLWVPITIAENILKRNGSCDSTWLPREKCATYYAGIYLLNIPSGKYSKIERNKIVDQEFYNKVEAVVYWMVFNNATNLAIEGNILEITSDYPLKNKPYGISIFQSSIGVTPDTIVKQNTFLGTSFIEKLCINNSKCYN